MAGEHNMIPVQVWADVDEGIAEMVKYLNTIPGVRTHASCQGTIGEGGAEPYGPYVLCSYQTDEAEMRLREEFDCTEIFMCTAHVRPKTCFMCEKPRSEHHPTENWCPGPNGWTYIKFTRATVGAYRAAREI